MKIPNSLKAYFEKKGIDYEVEDPNVIDGLLFGTLENNVDDFFAEVGDLVDTEVRRDAIRFFLKLATMVLPKNEGRLLALLTKIDWAEVDDVLEENVMDALEEIVPDGEIEIPHCFKEYFEAMDIDYDSDVDSESIDRLVDNLSVDDDDAIGLMAGYFDTSERDETIAELDELVFDTLENHFDDFVAEAGDSLNWEVTGEFYKYGVYDYDDPRWYNVEYEDIHAAHFVWQLRSMILPEHEKRLLDLLDEVDWSEIDEDLSEDISRVVSKIRNREIPINEDGKLYGEDPGHVWTKKAMMALGYYDPEDPDDDFRRFVDEDEEE